MSDQQQALRQLIARADHIHATVWRRHIDDTPTEWQYFTWTRCHPDCPACPDDNPMQDTAADKYW